MLTRLVARHMQRKPMGRRAWFRWYRVYRALPHWQLLRRRVYRDGRRRGLVGPLHAHHRHYRTLGREKIGPDVVAVTRARHARIHGMHQ